MDTNKNSTTVQKTLRPKVVCYLQIEPLEISPNIANKGQTTSDRGASDQLDTQRYLPSKWEVAWRLYVGVGVVSILGWGF